MSNKFNLSSLDIQDLLSVDLTPPPSDIGSMSSAPTSPESDVPQSPGSGKLIIMLVQVTQYAVADNEFVKITMHAALKIFVHNVW